MKIDWRDTDLSNHECIALASLAEQIGDTGIFDPVLPVSNGARVISLSRRGAPPGFEAVAVRHGRLIDDKYAAIDYDVHRHFRVQYQYRSASNYKLSGEMRLDGRLTPETHALLLTVLGGSEDGCFIPSQLKLEDLQFSAGWEVDFEGEDHVWHEFEGLYPARPGTAGLALDMIVAECRKTIQSGWDDIGAIIRLSEG